MTRNSDKWGCVGRIDNLSIAGMLLTTKERQMFHKEMVQLKISASKIFKKYEKLSDESRNNILKMQKQLS